jgi:hypothetical protein
MNFTRENGRRCLVHHEMHAKGWTLKEPNRWIDPVRAEKTRRSFALEAL